MTFPHQKRIPIPPHARHLPPRMKRFLLLASAMTALSLLGSCCNGAHPRFWKVVDKANGATAYTVDTAAAPVDSLGPEDVKYVNASGTGVAVSKPKFVRELSAQEWQTATSGARYSLLYCPVRKACWAKAKPR